MAEIRKLGYGKKVEDWIISSQVPNLVMVRVWERFRE
jgi:hypothetical protein